MDAAEFDLQYNPRATIKNFQEYFDRDEARSRKALRELDGYVDVPYGPHDAQKLDIFRARGESKAVLMFIHGGYWRALDKRFYNFLAPAFTRAGVTFANINYALCPMVTIEEIVRQVLQAGAWLYRNASNFGGQSRLQGQPVPDRRPADGLFQLVGRERQDNFGPLAQNVAKIHVAQGTVNKIGPHGDDDPQPAALIEQGGDQAVEKMNAGGFILNQGE